jgi:2-polyprenyl-6-methoxyphenol hydroxylase-like FAD-dependent oxidoreductase
MEPRRFVIVGGGTAGWLAALMLSHEAQRSGANWHVTVIESSRLGTIGVGEGTTAVFRQMLQRLGLDEMAFLRETGATIKYGIRHRDWRRLGHHYDGPIDDPHQAIGLGGGDNILDDFSVANGQPVGSTHLFQHLITGNRAPFALGQKGYVPAGPFHHAFHFDQALAGQFLRRNAKGIHLVDDEVQAVQRGPDGDITALSLASGAQVQGDFFIDCTGFRRRLIGEMGSKWVSYANVLPLNRAMPFWLDIPLGAEISPVTIAWAQKSGWMWMIPTQERMGCGYVYSDAHTTSEEAKAEIEGVLGHEIAPRNDIKIDAGRLDTSWRGNCVALGLASSFLEPLEATSIHGTIVQLTLLLSVLAKPNDRARDAFNAACARQVDDFRDFIRLHYVSERRDSAFWCDVAASHPAAVTDKLAAWAGRIPRPADFAPFAMGLPHVGHELHVPVLDGLGLISRQAAQSALYAQPKLRDLVAKSTAVLAADYAAAAAKCLPHRAFLAQLQQENAG